MHVQPVSGVREAALMANVSTAPDALDRIVALARLALPGVQVLDGGPIRDFADDGMAFGYTPNFGDDVVVDTRTQEMMSGDPDRENYDITCLAWSWKGTETDQRKVRVRAYELVDAIAAELAKDQMLGGLVLRARVSSTNLSQEQTTKGAAATVRFTINVSAYAKGF